MADNFNEMVNNEGREFTVIYIELDDAGGISDIKTGSKSVITKPFDLVFFLWDIVNVDVLDVTFTNGDLFIKGVKVAELKASIAQHLN